MYILTFSNNRGINKELIYLSMKEVILQIDSIELIDGEKITIEYREKY